MKNKKEILDLIYKSAQDLNKQLAASDRLKCDTGSTIIGHDSILDSLGIITLIVSIEEKIKDSGFDCDLMDTLTTEHDDVHPFATIGSLASWIESHIYS